MGREPGQTHPYSWPLRLAAHPNLPGTSDSLTTPSAIFDADGSGRAIPAWPHNVAIQRTAKQRFSDSAQCCKRAAGTGDSRLKGQLSRNASARSGAFRFFGWGAIFPGTPPDHRRSACTPPRTSAPPSPLPADAAQAPVRKDRGFFFARRSGPGPKGPGLFLCAAAGRG